MSTFSADRSKITIPELGSFPYIWLRDACQSETCVDPSTLQKLFCTSDIPLDVKPAPDGVFIADNQLNIRWMDGHTSSFSESFLKRYSKHSPALDEIDQACSWDNATISQTPDLFIQYDSIRTAAGLSRAFDHLSRYGLLFICGVSPDTKSHTECELVKLAGRFSEIRETFYGRVWDVISTPNSRNIAYTSLDLGLHMDLLYFQHPPQYQILHCLINQVEGGQSIFVDGLHAANQLQPSDFETLARTPVPFHYANDGHHLYQEHTTLELYSPQSIDTGRRKVRFVNYSPPFQAPFPLNTDISFYAALGRYAALLNKRENVYKYTLEEGVAVVFDNRRVLHARTAFKDMGGMQGKPNRWLKGCYLGEDALWERHRFLKSNVNK